MLKSTARDMLKFLDLFRTKGLTPGGRIVSERALRLMTSAHAFDPDEAHYGYGLYVPTYREATLINHAGGFKGMSAFFACVPERGLAAVALTNLSDAPAARITMNAIDWLMGLPLPDSP